MRVKRTAVVGIAFGLLTGFVLLGASLLIGSRATAASNQGQRWEYLVVALGSGKSENWCRKDYKSLENDCEGKVKAATVYEWDYLRAKGSYDLSYESTEFQGYLDRLGLEGWELVTVVGVIGGDDQEFVFKRPLP